MPKTNRERDYARIMLEYSIMLVSVGGERDYARIMLSQVHNEHCHRSVVENLLVNCEPRSREKRSISNFPILLIEFRYLVLLVWL